MYSRLKADILGFVEKYEGSIRGEWALPLIILTEETLYGKHRQGKTQDFLLVNEVLKSMKKKYEAKEPGIHRFGNVLEELAFIGIEADDEIDGEWNDQIEFMVNLIKQFCNFSYDYYDKQIGLQTDA
jgi:hypothetical protein